MPDQLMSEPGEAVTEGDGARALHRAAVQRLVASYHAIPPKASVRLAKKTSNLFRTRTRSSAPGLDVTGLDEVLAVDPATRTADVSGMCTYERLVAATLPHGLSPLVVPQLKTITLGGAVTGLGIEASSFRNGLPHESVLEMDILTGAGDVVTARPDGPHADLYRGFPNSYGTLGYATRLRIELEPVQPFVELRHVRFRSLESLVESLDRIVGHRSHDREDVDYVDGVVFSATESYLTLGRQSAEPGATSDYTGMGVYYRSLRHEGPEPKQDRLTVHDYLWRWDPDWFWCSRAFGAQIPAVRRLWPRRWRRSSVYWKLVALDHRWGVADRLEARRGRPPRERVVQDVEVPVGECASFLHWFLREVPIEPVWLCPLRLREDGPLAPRPGSRPWPLYPLRAGETYVNVGFWSTVPATPGRPGAVNRLIEQEVTARHGHKSLYSDSYYSPQEFDQLYGGDDYRALKERYDPGHRLLDLVGAHPADPYPVLAAMARVRFRVPPPRTLAAVARTFGADLLRPPPPPAQEALPRWRRMAEGLRHSRTRDAEAIHHHYDVSNTFYEHVLGPSMTYTCACYEHEGSSLEEAQENKYRLVFDKLRLNEGDRLLDIGCGWGGMVRYAARRGVRVIGATLSREQAQWAQAAIEREGLAHRAEVRFADYRDVPESGFDAVSSIGLTEHVGVRHYPSYFAGIRDRLRVGGLLLNHCITRPDNRTRSTGAFIDRYVFPDGELTGSGTVIAAAQDAGLEVRHEENLREHYALTLAAWCRNLEEHWDECVAEVGEATARVWGLYMAGSRYGFETNVVQLHQVLAVRPGRNGEAGLPLRQWWKA